MPEPLLDRPRAGQALGLRTLWASVLQSCQTPRRRSRLRPSAREHADPAAPLCGAPVDRDQIKFTFDRQPPTYDQHLSKLSALREGLHLLLGSVFAALPAQARILCVGAGTGAEIQHLAGLIPGWTFTAMEPSSAMLTACRERAEANGYAQRCLLEVWFRTMATADLSPEALQRMREAYRRDVAVLPPAEVEAIIRAGGFEAPVRFFQAGLIHGWFTRVTSA